MHYKLTGDKDDLPYMLIYLDFIHRCQKPDGSFINYVDEHNREHIEQNAEVNLEDSNARGIWALGSVIALKDILPENIVNTASECFLKSLSWAERLEMVRKLFNLRKWYSS